ncbi:hypothetical protein ACG95P_22470, partial [Acinetobacter guillouiae]|uniref:hypothetical protein n=1 Tax=Acinetobacter guillouiae TaxID=106649 RepID=UPI003AF6276B
DFLQYHLRHLAQFIQQLYDLDTKRSRTFEQNFSYQFYPGQRHDIQQNFEQKQTEMREFMQLYESFIAPVDNRYFPEDYELYLQQDM